MSETERLRAALEKLIQKAGWARHYGMVEGDPQWYELGAALLEARAAVSTERRLDVSPIENGAKLRAAIATLDSPPTGA